MWDIGTIEAKKKQTIEYTLGVPSVTTTKSYELKTIVEYQSLEDFETIEEIIYITVYPEEKIKIVKGKQTKKIKAKGKGYSKVHMGSRYSKGGSGGKKVAHGKGHGKGKQDWYIRNSKTVSVKAAETKTQNVHQTRVGTKKAELYFVFLFSYILDIWLLSNEKGIDKYKKMTA